jgi:hypothetical protein
VALLWLGGCAGTENDAENPGNLPTPAVTDSAGTAAQSDTASAAMPAPVESAAPVVQAPAPQAEPISAPAAAMPAPAMVAAPVVPEVQGIAPPAGFKAGAMNECDLHSGWAGDEYCILPPPPDKGFQLHFGPSNYQNPEPEYVLQPGQENVQKYTATSANDKDIKFYIRQYRMRPGAHHTIVRDTSTGRRLSGADVNQDHPVGGIIAPENADVGIPLAAHAPISTDHHAINTTDKPLLQEVWVNFWYVDPETAKETTTLLYDPGAVDVKIAPHADVVLGPYDCDIATPGRLINMFGHVHANNVRFSAWRTRGGKRDQIYESYHWEEPLWLEFTSLAKNKAADPNALIDGGWTGIVDLQPGDTISWECHEVNQQNTELKFTNQTYAGWMCIIIGELVGTKCMTRLKGVPINPSIE